MLRASQTYLLGGASLLLTAIVTVLNGVSYGVSRTSSPNSSLIEVITVSLSIISCAVILALIVIWAYDSKIYTRTRRKDWRARTYGTGIGCLSIITGITAGAITWSAVRSMTEANESTISLYRQLLLIARCVTWAISVLSQGMFCGFLLMILSTREKSHNERPGSTSHELDTIFPSRSVTINQKISIAPSSIAGSQRPSIDRIPQRQISASSAASQSSTRYSGKTLIQQDPKPNSLDLNPSLISCPECVPTRNRVDDHDSENRVADNPNRAQQLQRSNSEIKRSLDSVMLRPSSILSSCTQLDVTKRPLPKLKLPDESNIHPLFRSDSRSPPPTTTPGTMVVASPDAGQTISAKTLQRMRSTRSVGAYAPRSRSPLFERADQPSDKIDEPP